MLNNNILIRATDGFFRDASKISKRYKKSEKTDLAIKLIFEKLVKIEPKFIYIFLDKPFSKSGEFTLLINKKISEFRLEGTAKAVNSPDHEIIKKGETVISADSLLLDKGKTIFDLVAKNAANKVGAGFLGIPYVVSKSGLLFGLVWMIGLCFVLMLINLMMGEIILSSKTLHHIAGYSSKYLGKKTKWVVLISSIIGFYAALVAYLIGEGESFSYLFFGNISYSLWFGIGFQLQSLGAVGIFDRYKSGLYLHCNRHSKNLDLCDRCQGCLYQHGHLVSGWFPLRLRFFLYQRSRRRYRSRLLSVYRRADNQYTMVRRHDRRA